ncbi:unnamed protein product [Symbiodinium sp. CCMP2592]|nr:unnamed protein product [Symbiodinium sp. CCMP2592]
MISMRPASVFPMEAQADASAQGQRACIGGFVSHPSLGQRWFREEFTYEEFRELQIPVQQDMQLDIACYEALAQGALIIASSALIPCSRIKLRTVSDNSGAEAGVNASFTTSRPLAYFLERISLLAAVYRTTLDVSHIPGEKTPKQMHFQDRVNMRFPQIASMLIASGFVSVIFGCLDQPFLFRQAMLRWLGEVHTFDSFLLNEYSLIVVPIEKPKQEGVEGIGVPCPVCGFYYDNQTSVRKHLRRKHPDYQMPEIKFDPAEHAIGGLPQCAACKHRFQSWQELKVHIEKGRCHQQDVDTREPNTGPTQDVAPSLANPTLAAQTTEEKPRLPPHRNPRVADLIREQGWEALVSSEHAEEQIQMFGYLLPGLSESNKRPPATPQQQSTKGEESGKGGGKRRRTRRGQGSQSSAPAEALKKDGGKLLNLISRILLQHEDSINAAKMDRGFTVFMAQTGPAGLLTSLYQASLAWNQVRENEPAKITQPLRITLLTLMIAELKVRLQNLEKKPEAKQLAISAGWLDQQDRLQYQKWDAENKKLIPHPTMPGLTITEVMLNLTEIEPLILESLVLRFHAPRKLKPTPETENKAVFKLEVSLRSTEADQLYQSLAKLENNAVWQLIGCQLRKDGMRRSNPVQELMKLLSQGGSTCWGGDNHMCNTMWLSLHRICYGT